MFLAKVFRHAARFTLYLWVAISILRLLKHILVLASEPPLSPPPPFVSDYYYQYFLHRLLDLPDLQGGTL